MEIDFNLTMREVLDKLPNEIVGEILAEIVSQGFDIRIELRFMQPEFLTNYFAKVFNRCLNTVATEVMKEEQQEYLLKRLEEFENGLN